MILMLPTSNDPAQSFVTQLGSVKYQFDICWNDRAGVWNMDMTIASTQTPILQGVPLLLGADLLADYNLNMGSMIVVDEMGTSTDATVDDLGNRINVYWFSPDEVATL